MSEKYPALPAGPTSALTPPAQIRALKPEPPPTPAVGQPTAQVPKYNPSLPAPGPAAAPKQAGAPAAAEPATALEPAPALELGPTGRERPAGVAGKDVAEAAEKMGISITAMLEIFTYLRLVAQLAKAGRSLRGVGARVRETYEYVADCARSVDHQVALAAHLEVDTNTLAEHQQAAQAMRNALAAARRMATNAEEMAVLFAQAEAAHRTDYGAIAERAANMPGGIEMANRNFYRSR
ncbi:hypothetical protein [Streptomyces sp. NRRL S-87]|uniref:hypothetical protein n=1 Tax=Streptomyces sp. NRRL S-87 TaxID=1463920 RepID=UPI0004C0488A|nr:hypothetical protein [Streptomyces sp. NRRL S-87]